MSEDCVDADFSWIDEGNTCSRTTVRNRELLQDYRAMSLCQRPLGAPHEYAYNCMRTFVGVRMRIQVRMAV